MEKLILWGQDKSWEKMFSKHGKGKISLIKSSYKSKEKYHNLIKNGERK